jgi:hypothetical protein
LPGTSLAVRLHCSTSEINFVSSTVRPDNLKAALDAKLAAAMSQLVDLREAEQPRVTPHLNPREIIGTFLLYASAIYPIADTFGRAQAGDLQFDAWYGQWLGKLGDADRALWKQLRDERARQERHEHGHGAALVDVEIAVPSDPSITARQSVPPVRADVRKRLIRFAAAPNRAASDVCGDFLRLAKRFAGEFLRDYARFLP